MESSRDGEEMKAGDMTRVELPGREVMGKIVEVTQLPEGYQRVKIAYPTYHPYDVNLFGGEIHHVFDGEVAYLEIVLAPEE